MSAVASIIDRLGGSAKVAEAIAQPHGTVAAWKHRGSIPVRHWPRLSEMAVAANVGDVTYGHLVAAHAASGTLTKATTPRAVSA